MGVKLSSIFILFKVRDSDYMLYNTRCDLDNNEVNSSVRNRVFPFHLNNS